MSTIDTLIAQVRDALTTGSGKAVAEVLRAADLDVVRNASFPEFTDEGFTPVCIGSPASPGAASGRIVTSAESAVMAADAGERVILVRSETTPDDVIGMQVSAGILTARGGSSSHAAVVARGWGIPAVVGVGELSIEDGAIFVNGHRLAVGESISINGSTGEVFAGARAVTQVQFPPEIITLLEWADRATSGRVSIRANADNDADARHSIHLGARGIGLCRTEHMFLTPDRLPHIRRFILSDDGSAEANEALAELEELQRTDFESILRVMGGLPVTVRLLDPPLHEFLPDSAGLIDAESRGALDDQGRRVLQAVRRLHETNPMIGTRGVRLAVMRSGLYQMQVRALARAVMSLEGEGRESRVEVMIPMVVDPAEMKIARRWVADALHEVGMPPESMPVGAMIETPRAALIAGRLAEFSDFFSFGTNDLTQLTFAFSRDDVESRLIPSYNERGLLDHNPFTTIDRLGVARLIELACTDARSVCPDIRLSVCGEHAGDADSVFTLIAAGVSGLSCSPYRLPIARLAAAQALLASDDFDIESLAIAPGSSESVTSHTLTEVDLSVDIVMHVLRIKGFATVEGVTESTGAAAESVSSMLALLIQQGHVQFFEARGLYKLSAAGLDAHSTWMADQMVDDHRRLFHQSYGPFLTLNSSFKELCSLWQTRHGAPNDHSDPDYDARCIAELGELLSRSLEVLAGFTSASRRFELYSHRLRAAYARLEAGDTRMFTGVMCGSFHDVWMELHEDLVQLLGIDRVQEGSF